MGTRRTMMYAACAAALTLLPAACATGPDAPATGGATTALATVGGSSGASTTASATASTAPPTTPAPTSSSATRTTTSARPSTAKPPSSPAPPAAALPPGTTHADPIPYSATRKAEMAAYAKRHYGVDSSVLTPKVIVLHFTETDTFSPVWSTFAADTPNLGELPGTCSHFVVDQAGVVHTLVPTNLMCRHTIGLNHVAIGIEVVQASHGNGSVWADQQILHRPAQVGALVALVRQLQAQYGIATTDVIGHATANSHRLFVDLEGWRNDHTDWQAADVAAFRALL